MSETVPQDEGSVKTGMKLFNIETAMHWKENYKHNNVEQLVYESTVHTLEKDVYVALLAKNNVTDAHIEERKKEQLKAGIFALLFKTASNDMFAFNEAEGQEYLIESIEIWSYHERCQVKVNWPASQVTGEEAMENFKQIEIHQKKHVVCDKHFRKKKMEYLMRSSLEEKQRSIEQLKEQTSAVEKNAAGLKEKLEKITQELMTEKKLTMALHIENKHLCTANRQKCTQIQTLKRQAGIDKEEMKLLKVMKTNLETMYLEQNMGLEAMKQQNAGKLINMHTYYQTEVFKNKQRYDGLQQYFNVIQQQFNPQQIIFQNIQRMFIDQMTGQNNAGVVNAPNIDQGAPKND